MNAQMDIDKRNGYWVALLVLIFSANGRLLSQDRLSPLDAVKVGIERNFNIQILRNQETIAANNNTPGRAGMLPTVNTTGTSSYAINSTEQKFFTGESRGSNNASTIAFRLGLEVSWTAFDGFRMYVARDRFQALEEQSRMRTTAEMQALAADILLGYYNLVQLERSTENLRYAVRLDRDLLDLVENKKRIGTATGLELLQSKARLTADSVRLVQLEADIQRARKNFNQLLNRPVETTFSIDTTLKSGPVPSQEELLARAFQSNPTILINKLDRQLALLSMEDSKGAMWPEVTLQGTMNYSYQRNDVGFLLSNRNLGPTLGLTVRYTIFDGNNRKQDIANARINEEVARLRESDLLQAIEAQIRNQYADYLAFQQLTDLQQVNLNVASEQAALARELYRLGRTTNFEVREALLQEIQARDRLIQTVFQLKQTEISLLDLAGIPLYGGGQ